MGYDIVIKETADRVGAYTSTVSKALNGNSQISDVPKGDTGDLWCIDSTSTQIKTIMVKADGNEHFQYDPEPALNVLNMQSDQYGQKSEDLEKVYDEWGLLDIYTYHQENIHAVNGHLTDIGQIINGQMEPLTKGKIQLQSKGAEFLIAILHFNPYNHYHI